jgi:hypothetical protein
MQQGWIKLYRDIENWRYFSDANALQLFLYLIIHANTEDCYFQDELCKRGELITSVAHLSDVLRLSTQQVRTILKKLNGKELTIKTTNRNTHITICNYDSYQGEKKETNKENNKRITNEQQTNNKRITTIKEYKNKEYKKEEEISTNVDKEKKLSADSENFSSEKDSGNNAQLIPEEKEKEKKVAPKRESRFVPPTLEEVKDYETQKGYTFSAERFWGYYESNGWRVGKNPMKSWHGACVTWQGKQNEENNNLNLNQNATIQREGGRASADEPEWLRHQRENEEYLQYHLKRAMSKLDTKGDDKDVNGIF